MTPADAVVVASDTSSASAPHASALVSAVFAPSDDAMEANKLATAWQENVTVPAWSVCAVAVCDGDDTHLIGSGHRRHKVIATQGSAQVLRVWDVSSKTCELSLPLKERFGSHMIELRGAGVGIVAISDRFLLYGRVSPLPQTIASRNVLLLTSCACAIAFGRVPSCL